MIIGWNGETLPELELERESEIMAEAGYGGIELFVPKLPPFLASHSYDELARLLNFKALCPLSMNGIENINLRSPDEFEEVKKECQWLSEISGHIGCPVIVVVPSPLPQGMSREEAREDTVAALSVLADIANKESVTLGLEFLAPADCSVGTLAEAWDIVQATGRSNVGLVFDTYHFHVGGSSWESLEEFDIDRLYMVHINDGEDMPLDQLTDADRLLPGEGIFPLERMFERLHARGYNEVCSLEVMRPAYRERDPLEYARAGYEASRTVLQRAGVT